MIKNMILSLFSIVSNCIGNTWWTMDMHRNGTGFGMMVAHFSLRAANHGICVEVSKHDHGLQVLEFFWEWSWERSP
jgi:hypothetical protein